MASLQDLLAEEGFRRRSSGRAAKQKEKIVPEDSISLPIYICRDVKSVSLFHQRPEKGVPPRKPSSLKSAETGCRRVCSSRVGSKSELSRRVSLEIKGAGPALDEVAVRAVVSILGGYVGRFTKDAEFRSRVGSVCRACLAERDSENEILASLELEMENVELLAESSQVTKETKVKLLRNSTRLLSIVASLNSPYSKNGLTCGIPNSHLSACAQLYIAIIYKIEKNDLISARHLLQVFYDAPHLARTSLLPDLWEHFFLPHLLHLEVWYSEEVEYVSGLDVEGTKRGINTLRKVYNKQMDIGTMKFAVYYKEWLKVGGQAPAVPHVELPSRSFYNLLERESESSGLSDHINGNLYQPSLRNSCKYIRMEFEEEDGGFLHDHGKEDHFADQGALFSKYTVGSNGEDDKFIDYVIADKERLKRSATQKHGNPRITSSQVHGRSDYFHFLPCRGKAATGVLFHDDMFMSEVKNGIVNTHISNLGDAASVLCTSSNLVDCEIAVRLVAKAWLDSHEDVTVETALSKEPVIEGLLEVLFSSDDDEILELVISLLAELVVRNDMTRQILLNLDPRLEIFMRLLKNSRLFLKTAVFLYLMKPKVEQLSSTEWIPLVLKVLEYGNRLQTLFTIQCSPNVAVLYLLDQLMTGFNLDRNLNNVKQVIMLGGLKLILKSLEEGNPPEKKTAALLLVSCIQADPSCGPYVVNNIKKSSLLDLFLCDQQKLGAMGVLITTELLCLDLRIHVNKFLDELKNDGRLNAMHVLLVYLQQAPVEQRPLVAVILLQLDLMGRPSRTSLFREEAIDALIEAFDFDSHDKNTQEQLSRALLILGGRFSSGEASIEVWLLGKAAPNGELGDTSIQQGVASGTDGEDEEIENWTRKAATVLLVSGNRRLLAGLSKSIASGTPCLARACLVTAAWISHSLESIRDPDLRSMAYSILTPSLLETLSGNTDEVKRLLVSLTLANLARCLAS